MAKTIDANMMAKNLERTETQCNSVQNGEVETSFASSNDLLQRRLGNRQIQLIAIGGSIGTAVFVSVGNGLAEGGPGSLLLAFILATTMMGLVNNCMAEMAIYMPVSGAFIRMAGHWVDEAFGFLAGWNFFLYEAVLIPFEISALNLVLTFWRDDIPVAAVVSVCIVSYILINVFAVKFYGESEFWLSTGKLILFLILFFFTLVTMSGGNPKHDAYGFRYWSNPGAFAEYITAGPLGRFEGFLAALWIAVFTAAFKTTFYRFAFFFIGTALCVGIIIPYNDPTLVAILSGESKGAGTAAASPYVIAMSNLGIRVLPDITNALLVTSIFSAGNAYTYCGSRSLYSLALEKKAPKFFLYYTKDGVPIFCLGAVSLFSLLAFLSVSKSTSTVLDWLINILSTSQIINYIIICVTYLFFYRATEAQNFDRRTMPYYGYFQPYGAWVALIFYIVVIFVRGYSVFIPGRWDVGTFFTDYTMVGVAPLIYLGWKLVKRTKFVQPADCDLVWEAPVIDAYEQAFTEDTLGFWTEILQMFGFRRQAWRNAGRA